MPSTHDDIEASELEYIRMALIYDFEKLYVRQFTADWQTQRFIRNMEISQMALDTILTLIRRREREAVEAAGENTSDGYHTFKELYEFRLLYNAALFNAWAAQGKYSTYKSKLHSDGEIPFGGGWFIVGAQLSTGQISNHYELKDWDLFQIDEVERAPEWDGHTPQDVAKRLLDQLEAEEQ